MSGEHYTTESYGSRADWLRARKRSIGASEASAILGFNRKRSIYSVATDKRTEAVDEVMDETAEWGIRNEPAIAQKLSEVLNVAITDPGDYTIYRSVDRPWLTCTPDRLIYILGVLADAVELKCAYYEAVKEWTQRIPLAHQIQGQQTLYVLGLDRIYFAALLNGCSFRWHTMARNQKWIDRMLPKLDAFWESIQRGEMPAVDGSMATSQALARTYPKPGDGIVEAPDEYATIGEEYDAILEQANKLEKRKLEIQNCVKEIIGENKTAVLTDRSGFSWNGNGKGSRTFRRVKKVGDLDE